MDGCAVEKSRGVLAGISDAATATGALQDGPGLAVKWMHHY